MSSFLFLSFSTRGLVLWYVFMLTLGLFKTLSTCCAFLLVLYDPIFPLGVNVHVPMHYLESSEAVKSVGECSGTERGNRTLLPSCSLKNQPELIWSPKPSCWRLLDLCVWFIFWMCFSSQLLHHSCSIMPCSKHVFYNSLPYMESMHQACLNFSCHVSAVLCFTPNGF